MKNQLEAFRGPMVEFSIDGGRLKFRVTEGRITDGLRQSVSRHQDELLGLLQGQQVWDFKFVNFNGNPWLIGWRLDGFGWRFWFVENGAIRHDAARDQVRQRRSCLGLYSLPIRQQLAAERQGQAAFQKGLPL